jgi:hypothetical protein
LYDSAEAAHLAEDAEYLRDLDIRSQQARARERDQANQDEADFIKALSKISVASVIMPALASAPSSAKTSTQAIKRYRQEDLPINQQNKQPRSAEQLINVAATRISSPPLCALELRSAAFLLRSGAQNKLKSAEIGAAQELSSGHQTILRADEPKEFASIGLVQYDSDE